MNRIYHHCAELVVATLSVLFVVYAVSTQAQAPSFRLTKITVTGAQSFNEQQIVTVSGLFPGESVTLQDLRDAVNRLVQYGAFQQVSYQYDTQDKEMDLEFKVIESNKLLPCRFENFVWFAPTELNNQLDHDVPLYSGSAPPSGQMLQAIVATLRAMLKTKGINGDISSMPFSSAPGQPISALEFTVTGVSLPIRDIHFPGASGIPEDTLVKKSKPLLGADYDESEVSIFARETLLDLYSERGYLLAQFGEPVAHLQGTNVGNSTQDVSVTVPVHEGVAYDWNGAEWSGNKLFPSAALDKLLGMRTRTVANMTAYGQGIKNIRDAYMKKGYLEIKISPQSVLDDATRRVSYRFFLDEGPQFHMGILTIKGIPENAMRRLLKEWKLKPGDAYDGTYLDQFVKQALPNFLRSGTRGATSNTSIHPDSSTHTVNIEIDLQ